MVGIDDGGLEIGDVGEMGFWNYVGVLVGVFEWTVKGQGMFFWARKGWRRCSSRDLRWIGGLGTLGEIRDILS